MAVDFPSLSIGDLVIMLDGAKPFRDDSATLFEVSGREEIPSMPHGAICLLSAGAQAPNAYTMDGKGVVSQSIPSGNTSPKVAPLVLQTDQYQLAEWRPRFNFLNIDGTVVADDLSVLAFSGNLPRWTTVNVTGEMNAMMQFPEPLDSALAPARGSSMTAPSAYAGVDPSFWSPTLWSYFTRFQPTFQLKNNGGITVGTNGTFAWLMRCHGFVYNLTTYPLGANPHEEVLAGSSVTLPHDVGRRDVRVVQMTAREPKAAPSQSS